MSNFSCGHYQDTEDDGQAVIEVTYGDLGKPCLEYKTVCNGCYDELIKEENVFCITQEDLAFEYFYEMGD